MKTNQTTYPNSLRQYRNAAGLRQVDVAARLGLKNTDRISHWEKGRTLPSITNLFKLSAIYRVPAHDLYAEFSQEIEKTVNPVADAQAASPKELATGVGSDTIQEWKPI